MLRVLCAGLFAVAVTFLAGCDTKTKPIEVRGQVTATNTTRRTPGI